MTFVLKNSYKSRLSHSVTIAVAAGFALGIAWIYPGSSVAVFLGWIATLGLIAIASLDRHAIKASVICGTIAFLMSTFWFFDSVQRFTESPLWLASLLTFPFLIWHVAQFVLFVIVYRLLPPILNQIGVRAALAWVSLEVCWPRLFPWTLGNTQLGFTSFIQPGELFGAFGVSFLLLFFCSQIYSLVTSRSRPVTSVVVLFLFILTMFLSKQRIQAIDSSIVGDLRVGIVQVAKGSSDPSAREMTWEQRLLKYTESIAGNSDVVIWPERSLSFETHESIGHRDNEPRLRDIKPQVALLTGILTYRPPKKKFNSVMLIEADGKIPVPYHKRYLMPFGEFLPLPYVFDWLGVSALAPKSDIAAGNTATVFRVNGQNLKDPAKIAPLICYEDLRPELGQTSVANSANILLDLSAGSWPNSVLPLYQHQTIAAFRAIETRKSFIRVSAHGPSAYIDPVGRVHPVFDAEEAGAKVVSVPVSDARSRYSILGKIFPYFVVCLTAFLGLITLLSKRDFFRKSVNLAGRSLH